MSAWDSLSRDVNVEDVQWSAPILRYLGRLQKRNSLCDMSFRCCDGVTVSTHACVFSAMSETIRHYIDSPGGVNDRGGSNGGNYDVMLDTISSITMTHIIRFLYNGRVSFPITQFSAVLDASKRLGITALLDRLITVAQAGTGSVAVQPILSEQRPSAGNVILLDDDGDNGGGSSNEISLMQQNTERRDTTSENVVTSTRVLSDESSLSPVIVEDDESIVLSTEVQASNFEHGSSALPAAATADFVSSNNHRPESSMSTTVATSTSTVSSDTVQNDVDMSLCITINSSGLENNSSVASDDAANRIPSWVPPTVSGNTGSLSAECMLISEILTHLPSVTSTDQIDQRNVARVSSDSTSSVLAHRDEQSMCLPLHVEIPHDSSNEKSLYQASLNVFPSTISRDSSSALLVTRPASQFPVSSSKLTMPSVTSSTNLSQTSSVSVPPVCSALSSAAELLCSQSPAHSCNLQKSRLLDDCAMTTIHVSAPFAFPSGPLSTVVLSTPRATTYQPVTQSPGVEIPTVSVSPTNVGGFLRGAIDGECVAKSTTACVVSTAVECLVNSTGEQVVTGISKQVVNSVGEQVMITASEHVSTGQTESLWLYRPPPAKYIPLPVSGDLASSTRTGYVGQHIHQSTMVNQRVSAHQGVSPNPVSSHAEVSSHPSVSSHPGVSPQPGVASQTGVSSHQHVSSQSGVSSQQRMSSQQGVSSQPCVSSQQVVSSQQGIPLPQGISSLAAAHRMPQVVGAQQSVGSIPRVTAICEWRPNKVNAASTFVAPVDYRTTAAEPTLSTTTQAALPSPTQSAFSSQSGASSTGSSVVLCPLYAVTTRADVDRSFDVVRAPQGRMNRPSSMQDSFSCRPFVANARLLANALTLRNPLTAGITSIPSGFLNRGFVGMAVTSQPNVKYPELFSSRNTIGMAYSTAAPPLSTNSVVNVWPATQSNGDAGSGATDMNYRQVDVRLPVNNLRSDGRGDGRVTNDARDFATCFPYNPGGGIQYLDYQNRFIAHHSHPTINDVTQNIGQRSTVGAQQVQGSQVGSFLCSPDLNVQNASSMGNGIKFRQVSNNIQSCFGVNIPLPTSAQFPIQHALNVNQQNSVTSTYNVQLSSRNIHIGNLPSTSQLNSIQYSPRLNAQTVQSLYSVSEPNAAVHDLRLNVQNAGSIYTTRASSNPSDHDNTCSRQNTINASGSQALQRISSVQQAANSYQHPKAPLAYISADIRPHPPNASLALRGGPNGIHPMQNMSSAELLHTSGPSRDPRLNPRSFYSIQPPPSSIPVLQSSISQDANIERDPRLMSRSAGMVHPAAATSLAQQGSALANMSLGHHLVGSIPSVSGANSMSQGAFNGTNSTPTAHCMRNSRNITAPCTTSSVLMIDSFHAHDYHSSVSHSTHDSNNCDLNRSDSRSHERNKSSSSLPATNSCSGQLDQILNVHSKSVGIDKLVRGPYVSNAESMHSSSGVQISNSFQASPGVQNVNSFRIPGSQNIHNICNPGVLRNLNVDPIPVAQNMNSLHRPAVQNVNCSNIPSGVQNMNSIHSPGAQNVTSLHSSPGAQNNTIIRSPVVQNFHDNHISGAHNVSYQHSSPHAQNNNSAVHSSPVAQSDINIPFKPSAPNVASVRANTSLQTINSMQRDAVQHNTCAVLRSFDPVSRACSEAESHHPPICTQDNIESIPQGILCDRRLQVNDKNIGKPIPVLVGHNASKLIFSSDSIRHQNSDPHNHDLDRLTTSTAHLASTGNISNVLPDTPNPATGPGHLKTSVENCLPGQGMQQLVDAVEFLSHQSRASGNMSESPNHYESVSMSETCTTVAPVSLGAVTTNPCKVRGGDKLDYGPKSKRRKFSESHESTVSCASNIRGIGVRNQKVDGDATANSGSKAGTRAPEKQFLLVGESERHTAKQSTNLAESVPMPPEQCTNDNVKMMPCVQSVCERVKLRTSSVSGSISENDDSTAPAPMIKKRKGKRASADVTDDAVSTTEDVKPKLSDSGVRFVGKRIFHKWIEDDANSAYRWYPGTVEFVLSGQDGVKGCVHRVIYDYDPEEYDVSHLLEDFLEGSLQFIPADSPPRKSHAHGSHRSGNSKDKPSSANGL